MNTAQLVDAYLAPYGQRTRDNYAGYLRRWCAWCTERGIDPAAPTRADIEGWIGSMREEGLTDNTVRSYVTAVSGLCRYLVSEGHLDRDPSRHARKPTAPRLSARPWLSRPELRAFIEAAQADREPGTRAALLIPATCGTRPAETVGLNIADVGERVLEIDGRAEEHVTIALRDRKCGGSDILTVPPIVGIAIRDAIGSRTSGPLLVSEWTGLRMSQHVVRARMRRVLEAAGIPRPVTPYGLRHSVITLALEAGVPEREVAAWAGHASTSQMPIYDHLRSVAGGNVARAVYAHVTGEINRHGL